MMLGERCRSLLHLLNPLNPKCSMVAAERKAREDAEGIKLEPL